MTALEQILGSPEQLHLLRFFLFHPDEDLAATEIKKKIGKRSRHWTRALQTLTRLGCIVEHVQEGSREHAWRMNTGWLLYPEFRALFVKAQLLVEHDLIRKIEKTGKVRLLILSGLFVGQRGTATDVLIVGSVHHQRVMRLLKGFEHDLDQEVRYTILSSHEYFYRKNVGDRFLYDILENRHLVVLDTLERPRVRRQSAAPAHKTALSRKRKIKR